MLRNRIYTSDEVEDFLSSIDLLEYKSQLSSLSILDLLSITDEKLEELGVKIRIHRVKIIDSLKCIESNPNTYDFTETELTDYGSQNTAELLDLSENSQEIMGLRSISGYLDGILFAIGERGAKIGRSTSMDIAIPDGFVSRKHCEILYEKSSNKFLLKDTGSTTGTFFMVFNWFALNINTMFQVGQCEFKVANISFNLDGTPASMELIKYEGPSSLSLIITQGGLIGRSRSCEISVPEDNMMSFEHARISIKNSSFAVEDLNSLNGTWVRLSPEGVFSESYTLVRGDHIKIGCAVFIVEPFEKKRSIGLNNECTMCLNREKNTEVLPCCHRFCLGCACSLVICIVCGKPIKEVSRVV